MQGSEIIPADAPPWLTCLQLAGYLGVSDESVRRWARAGTLPGAFRLGARSYRFRTREVRDWVHRACNLAKHVQSAAAAEPAAADQHPPQPKNHVLLPTGT